ncbi:hypothetical protein [Microcoleus sp. bin38.metabat.b11b12b14.051]|uniref:hypothetical protein n=1 Tax=Microcoleus sp. bin38.metabat.b11b12b14.051 TaxID=2742709 RepID=UPI0025FAD8B8|nr:hypothetical protein [Microcoleus sp. bin38.metabat.b11b12b14.051]
MSQHDPTAIEVTDGEFSLGEMSVDETAASQAIEAGTGDPTQPVGTIAGTVPVDSALPNIPIIPIPIAKRPVSGRYRGTVGGFQLEIRVDVDRTRPMKRLSGDFYQISGQTVTYFASFIVDAPTITVTASQVTVKGLGSFTFAAGAPVVQVTMERRLIFQPQAPATVQFFTTGGSPGATYTCAFESIYFRTAHIETDRVSDVSTPVFSSYNTGSLPSGGPARNLSVVGAYGEAGIEMIPTAASDVINISEAGADAQWSNAELHASMQNHFSLWQDQPQWAIWQVAAQLHEIGPTLYGIMFDQQGKQRQGCAVFHTGIGGETAEQLRLQAYTYVHELGHGFNLLHSWQKQYASPPQPNRVNALSWMNYPWNYPGGPAVFWNSFAFGFDNEEVIHMRHGFRNNVIMGGSNFAVGAALGREIMADPVRDESGLKLTISTHQKNFGLGEPVVLQLMLQTTDARGRRVHTWLHPNFSMVKIVIRKPSGEVVAYEPLIEHLVGPRESVIGIDDTIAESAYIGYGKDGLYFEEPGNYRIRACYAALDGSQVMSDIITVRVRYPVTAAEAELADLFIGDEQGTLLYLLGSDHESLRRGNEAFDEILAKYPDNAMTNYVRLVKGINASRNFKTITDKNENRVMVRPAELEQSSKLLSAVADSGVLDPVSAKMTLTNLAEVQTKAGDDEALKQTLSKLSAIAIGKW